MKTESFMNRPIQKNGRPINNIYTSSFPTRRGILDIDSTPQKSHGPKEIPSYYQRLNKYSTLTNPPTKKVDIPCFLPNKDDIIDSFEENTVSDFTFNEFNNLNDGKFKHHNEVFISSDDISTRLIRTNSAVSSKKSSQLEIIVRAIVEDPKSATSINLSNKNLTTIQNFNEILPNVFSCNVSFNSLVSIRGLNKNITTLKASNNKLGSHTCHLDLLPHLEDLDLSYNCLGPDLKLLSLSLHLRFVNLSHNNISSLNGLSLSRIPIESLNLSYNKISGFIDFKQILNNVNGCEQNWSRLKNLDLSNNNIVSIKNVSFLKNLHSINLDNNPMKFLQETTHQISQLQALSILGTNFCLNDIFIRQVSELPFTKLTILKLDGFKKISKWTFLPKNLKELTIKNCFINCLPNWKNLPKTLLTLRLEYINDLTELPKDFNLFLPLLKELYLPNNNLRSCYNLIENIPNKSLVKVDLRNNPIAIDYESKFENIDENNVNFTTTNRSVNLRELIELACPKIKTILLTSSD
ncbi:hypothetical protein KAFR_0I00190 [Kazachstania africana CBS 2517]|uniref:Uncharacterized protein n=1 Tax=Kazachstania africana (strain ATCC 22294 / BCRC 22015 / CBS 2517 / CECT 1963 / NBRC 1671 / NRRL Y-8276) TaxID=1071382 RepID=H2AZK0_KAZAF|nr:hypothetical protein KAFR_0I00190 [Kazachstania africana CBS 2517]CCF59800.1 hypothetical protein KAFR_0I00190 [Kazachstania africana CBS 2517]